LLGSRIKTYLGSIEHLLSIIVFCNKSRPCLISP
jgi:hypothetical protein